MSGEDKPRGRGRPSSAWDGNDDGHRHFPKSQLLLFDTQHFWGLVTYGPAVEEAGFAAWYEREHPRLLGSLFALTRDLELAREATDECFARALASWPKVRNMAYPTAWLHRVGLNFVNRQFRRHSREQLALRRLPVPTGVADDHTEVWEAVAALPLRQRTAIVLRYLADLPETAIAEAMGVSRGTVASTLSDARHRLGHLLADHDTTQEAPYA